MNCRNTSRRFPAFSFCALLVLAPLNLLGQTSSQKPDPQQQTGGTSTGTPVNYTSKKTVGITDPKAPVVFEDVTDKTALANFKHHSGTPAKDYIFEVSSGGVAIFDYDGDGLPDAWEVAHGLDARDATGDNGASGDPDGDGMTNLQEYLSGTDPRDSTSYLKIESIGTVSAATRIRFNAVAGKTYSIQYRDQVDLGRWTKLTDVPAQPSTGEIEMMDPDAATNATRFYRLVTPQLP